MSDFVSEGYWRQIQKQQQIIEHQAAQIEMMRDFIETAPVSTGVCCCGESMEGHSSSMNCSHTPVDLWDHSVEQILSTTPDQALEQRAAIRVITGLPKGELK